MTETTTTVWEFLFPEIHRDTTSASRNVREDLSTFLQNYAQRLDDLYQAIDQNPCQTWGTTSFIGLKCPFPTIRTLDELFEGHDDDLVYPIKLLTQFITYIDDCAVKAETEFYAPISMFGETVEELPCPSPDLMTDTGIPRGDLEKMVGDAIPMLTKLAGFLPEFISVGKRFIEYLLFLYSPENEFFYEYFQSTPLIASFEALGRFLRILYTISTLIADNPFLSSAWDEYCRMIFDVHKVPDVYKATPEDITLLENSVNQIHRIVFSGDFISKFFQTIAPLGVTEAGHQLGFNLGRYLDDEIVSYTKLIKAGEVADQEDTITDLTLELHLLLIFDPNPKSKTRLITNFWNTYPIVPIVKLYHYVSFCPVVYLQENLQSLVSSVLGADAFRQAQQRILKLSNYNNIIFN